jgi:methyl coenzyme M reductase subunit C-like uncharacterized protein (methanogenesis marker protein 7)
MELFLNVLFALGAAVAVIGLAAGVVRRLRDHRTPAERLADEHGDIAPGAFKVTPGIGQNTSGPGSSTM